ncbi:hypothetical protein V2J09_015250 [Rumex salicifolius]
MSTGDLINIHPSELKFPFTMQAQKEAPADMQCKDKFLVQSVIAPEGATTKDLAAEMFNKEEGKVVEEFKLRVIYIPANPPSPVPEESEEGSPPRPTGQENGYQAASSVARRLDDFKGNSSEDLISKLTEEKASAIQQNQKLRQEVTWYQDSCDESPPFAWP